MSKNKTALITGATGGLGLSIAKEFYDDLKAQIQDVKDFVKSKENCQFAAAQLANCIISQAISNLSFKGIKDISSGLGSIDSKVSKLAGKISKPADVISGYMNKGSKELKRAASVIEATKII